MAAGHARAAARMQRELKMLETSPAPGVAAWPAPGPDGTGDRMDTLDAEIRGSHGTPYANGVFKLRVEIPPRYPLEPPRVKFVTPIYHPNIDSAGRICLNILNMPPKGGWSPALNVSTVLKGVQVLMNEPNPDDGLMADVTDEYKRNISLFNEKAAALTAKHAIATSTDQNGQPPQALSPRTHRNSPNLADSPIRPVNQPGTDAPTPATNEVRNSPNSADSPIRPVKQLATNEVRNSPNSADSPIRPVNQPGTDAPTTATNEILLHPVTSEQQVPPLIRSRTPSRVTKRKQNNANRHSSQLQTPRLSTAETQQGQDDLTTARASPRRVPPNSETEGVIGATPTRSSRRFVSISSAICTATVEENQTSAQADMDINPSRQKRSRLSRKKK